MFKIWLQHKNGRQQVVARLTDLFETVCNVAENEAVITGKHIFVTDENNELLWQS